MAKRMGVRRGAEPRTRPTRKSPLTMSRDGFADAFDVMVRNIQRVIKGKEDIVRLSLVALLAEGHILFDDYPGTGKTMLARSIAQTIDAKISRIQCTPDLLPGDITGSPVLDRASGDFVFRPGPVFGNVLIADEINRATPKTQSALLEAMQEKTVTVDGITHPLPRPFFVLATQNPIELAGTFPLPEAQVDRFLFKLSLGYPSRAAEAEVLSVNSKTEAIQDLGAVIDASEVVDLINWAAEVTVSEPVALYIIDLVQATRTDPSLEMGASPRASLALQKASRVLAASQRRDDVLPDDVKKILSSVLGHRLILKPDAQLRNETIEQVIERAVAKVRVPTGIGAGFAH